MQHITNSEAAINNHELFYANNFRVEIISPQIIRDVTLDRVIMQSVNTVSGLETDKHPGVIQQSFGGAKANYAAGVIEDNTQTFSMTLPLVLRGENMTDFYVYKYFKAWLALIQDPRTGEQHLKRDYVGEVIVSNYTRGVDGQKFWIRNFKNVFIGDSLAGIDLDKDNGDVTEFEVTFVADYLIETMV